MTTARDIAGEERIEFPEGFTWGVATAAHQIEGGNVNNDWWAWEHDPDSGTVASSGDACDSFHRWREDVDLVGDLGFDGLPIFARVEPDRARRRGVLRWPPSSTTGGCAPPATGEGCCPVVTFHHFTTPLWLAGRGGWEAPDAPECFARFVTRAAAYLGDLIGWACTINEPNVVGVMGYFQGQYPPGVKDDFFRFTAVNEAMVRAHRLAVEAMRSGPGDYPVGLTLSMAEITAEAGGESLRDAAEEVLENTFLRATAGDDFVGVQCYTRMHFGPDGQAPNDPSVPVTQMDDERWPQAVEFCVRRAAAISGRPVVVTENGIATADDADRIAFLTRGHRERAPLPGRGHRPPGLLRLEPARQLRVAPGLRAAVRDGVGGPGYVRAPPQAERLLVRAGGTGQRVGHRPHLGGPQETKWSSG